MSATTTSTGRQDAKERVCGTGMISRPRFSPGLLLLDDDLTAGVEYTRQLSRLLFRHLFGCGVVCGLKVTARHERHGDCLHVDVDAGLALDCEGDPVHVPHPQRLTVRRECGEPLPRELWVLLRRTQQDCVPRGLACPPEDGGSDSVATRLRDGYEIALLNERPKESCGCPELAEPVGGVAPRHRDSTREPPRLAGQAWRSTWRRGTPPRGRS
ncbi:hypothetical protein [Siccirubricoccus sp. G192]|uniref:hypothetical protein n=1 Tax=Siccirubricoccus sp. G192 TaxID=2849651 RepID=UPI001C2C8CB9|nr:hypothetical protein [Siccirubricoccus sp. G192]MBV1800695.1 hypothetical protein [Siccirubricoccus sp. G192]